ncbi:unnamed protein product [Medioppia subpectinata]|uniref:Methyltransferase domain-containing protein n=1 Tax=Medioppia subpectinata TaxID=1979941 RepID=A0A7R9KIG6_9ACAR|nr:unnamed protein product [Medioppia subpectinata]CAG2103941.1 unnamed protein product [Medioppia subpectinata]
MSQKCVSDPLSSALISLRARSRLQSLKDRVLWDEYRVSVLNTGHEDCATHNTTHYNHSNYNNNCSEKVDNNNDLMDDSSDSRRRRRRSSNKSRVPDHRSWDLYVYTIAAFINHFAYGVTQGLIGPTLVDLKYMLNTTMNLISISLIFNNIGYLSGSLSMAASSALIPDSPNLWTLYVFQYFSGLGAGIWDTANNVWLIEMWPHNSLPVLQFSQFMWGLGSVIAPIIAKPYLTGETNHTVVTPTPVTYHALMADTITTTTPAPVPVDRRALLRTPFLISGILQAFIPLVFLIMYFVRKYKSPDERLKRKDSSENLLANDELDDNHHSVESEPRDETPGASTARKNAVLIALFSLFLAMYSSLEIAHFNYSPTYYQYTALRLSAQTAASILSTMCTSYTVGRCLSAFVALRVGPDVMISYHLLIIIAGMGVLYYGSTVLELIWIGNIIIGFGFSAMYSAIIGLTARHCALTDTVSTVMVFTNGIVSAITPFILGPLIETNPFAFIELELVYLVISAALFLAILSFTRTARPHNRALQSPEGTTGGDKSKYELPLEDDVDTSLAWGFVLGDPYRMVGPKNALFKKKCEEISGQGTKEKLKKIREYLSLKYSNNTLIKNLTMTKPENVVKAFCEPIIKETFKGWKQFNDKYKESEKIRNQMMDVFMEANKTRGTTITIPKLVCYIRLYKNQTIHVYTEQNNTREFARKYFAIFDEAVGVINAHTGAKNMSDCKFDGVPKSTVQGTAEAMFELPLEDDVDTSLAWAFVLGDPNRMIGPTDKLFKQKCMEISGQGNTEKLQKIREYVTNKYSTNKLIVKLAQTKADQIWKAFCEPIISGSYKGWKQFNERFVESAKVREHMMDVFMEANKNSSTITIPKLICYIRLYKEKTINVHSDIDNAREFVRKYFSIFDEVVGVIEADTGAKGAPECKFDGVPKSTALPPQSVYLALLAAVNNLTLKCDRNRWESEAAMDATLSARQELSEIDLNLGLEQPIDELIKRIKENNHDDKYPLVMDIGCGPGNTAKLLAKELNPEHIVGVDIDRDMIAFVKQHNAMANTDYYIQDITQEWKEWDKSLQKLAGKVSVIFSNFTLHWVRESETAAQNMSKLLSNNGIIVMNILYCGDIYRNAGTDDRRAQLERQLRYPSEQQLIGQWVTAFKSVGLNRIDIKYWEPKALFPVNVYNEIIQMYINWYKQFLTDSTGNEDMDTVLRELIIKYFETWKTSKILVNGKDLIEVNRELQETNKINDTLGSAKPHDKLIKHIKNNNNDDKYPLVMDIGCGPGNTAKLLAKELNPEHIVGIDTNPDMIAFAKQHNAMANTDYYVQDISQEWNQWNKSLQMLAGKVSVIFSNHTLHWVRESETAAQNMAKLLSSNGIIVMNISYFGDIYCNAGTDERRAELERQLRYPSEQQLIGQWVTAFKSAGLNRIDIKYWKSKFIISANFYNDMIGVSINWYKQFLTDSTGNEDMDTVLRELIIKYFETQNMVKQLPNDKDVIEAKGEVCDFVISI